MLVGNLVTTKEAAELLRVSHWTISAWLSKGKLKRVKAGGRTLIAKADLEAFLRHEHGRASGVNPTIDEVG
jgi:excisionase family DNA binding protein